MHHVQVDRKTFYALCDNTVVDLDLLLVIRVLLEAVEPALFE
jgi:hypothetical protein